MGKRIEQRIEGGKEREEKGQFIRKRRNIIFKNA